MHPEWEPVIIPKKKPKKTAENRVETKWEKAIRIAKKTAGAFTGSSDEGRDRREQFQSYMSMIDRLQKQKFYFRNQVRARNPGEQLIAQAGQIGSAKTTSMSTILDKYHDKALRLAQAKYYQKQTG